jgi:CDP-diacylglycerol--glycerol-3-phosphate 3-phosphatidyltransferase
MLLASDDPSSRFAAAGLIALAVATDFLDGLLARKFQQVTDLGKTIDPLADKIGVGVIAIVLAQHGKLPLWFLILVLLRDVAIFLGAAYVRRSRGVVLQSNEAGKWAVSLIAALILLCVLDTGDLRWIRELLLFATAGMLVLSFVLYLKRFLTVIRDPGGY